MALQDSSGFRIDTLFPRFMVPGEMKKSWGFLIFALGLSLGWAIRGGTPSEPKPGAADAPVTKSPRTRDSSSAKSAHDMKWLVIGKRAKELGYQERETVLKELDPKNRIAALEALASQAGLNGLDYQVKSLMEKILENWAVEDFDGAWQEARATSNRDLADFMMKAVLGELAKTDPDRAFALHLEQKAIDPEFSSGAPGRMLSAKLKVSAADYLDVLKQLPFGNSSGGSGETFASDFDFGFAADGLAKLMKEQGNKNPSHFPSNFYTEWAKKDPEAVFAWWSANSSLPFNDLDEILQGLESHAPGKSAEWLAEKLQDPAMPREKIIRNLSELGENLSLRVNSVASALPDDAAADAFLTDILTFHSYSNPLERYSFAISALSSPEARLQAFQVMQSKHRALEIGKISDAQLQAWGITRQQVEQAVAND